VKLCDVVFNVINITLKLVARAEFNQRPYDLR